MPNREEALRKIFDSTWVSGRLTADQKRKLPALVSSYLDTRYLAGIRSGTTGAGAGGAFGGFGGGGGGGGGGGFGRRGG